MGHYLVSKEKKKSGCCTDALVLCFFDRGVMILAQLTPRESVRIVPKAYYLIKYRRTGTSTFRAQTKFLYTTGSRWNRRRRRSTPRTPAVLPRRTGGVADIKYRLLTALYLIRFACYSPGSRNEGCACNMVLVEAEHLAMFRFAFFGVCSLSSGAHLQAIHHPPRHLQQSSVLPIETKVEKREYFE